jgi:hypothetical protein
MNIFIDHCSKTDHCVHPHYHDLSASSEATFSSLRTMFLYPVLCLYTTHIWHCLGTYSLCSTGHISSVSIFTCWDYGFRKCSWVLSKALLNKDFSLFPIICRGPDTVGFYCFTSSLLDALCTGRSVLSVSPPSDPRTDSVRDYKGSCAILVSLRGTCNVVASISPRLWGHVDG